MTMVRFLSIWLPCGIQRLVLATMVRALGLRDPGRRTAEQELFAYLRGRQMLLLLDNFEHLLAAAPSVADLLEECGRCW
jgi:predicted ATPase